MSKLNNLCRLAFTDEDLSMSFPSHSGHYSKENDCFLSVSDKSMAVV